MRDGRYFKLPEFACKGGCCCGGEAVVDQRLVDSLDRLREQFGEPIVVTSGYRCEIHNREIGGAEDSQHVAGRAADIKPLNCTRATFARLASLLSPTISDWSGVGVYINNADPTRGWMHVDLREADFARWGQVDGARTTYRAAFDQALALAQSDHDREDRDGEETT